jgi:methylenetetrahydrofolate dehydrogenase (NADP+)/methenyltetrahydrofolate cyclohydrolase
MAEARALLGRPVALALADRIRERAERFASKAGRPPKLAVLAVDDPAGQSYLKSLRIASEKAGVLVEEHGIAQSATTESVVAELIKLNEDRAVDGILIQTPLPKGVGQAAVARVLDPRKDVDGITPTQAGLLFQGFEAALAPCTARAVMEVLSFYNYGLMGLEVVVIGRSLVVGRPVAVLALAQHATVTWCHTRTLSLPAICKRAELLIVAVGSPRLVNSNYVRPGATVIDVGINFDDQGRMAGDVDSESIMTVAAAYTPVPGGVGPVTSACLFANLLDSASAKAG